jgi:hypothetical protein
VATSRLGIALFDKLEEADMAVTKQKGLQAELYVAYLLIRNGFHVLLPFGEDARYDLVSEKHGVFKRIQVKYVALKNGALEVPLRSANNHQTIYYSPADVDVIAAYNPENSKVYFIPRGEIVNKSCLKLRLADCKNGQRRHVVWAADYELKFNVLEAQGLPV